MLLTLDLFLTIHNSMQLAKGTLRLNEGTTVQIKDVTPTEAAMLNVMFSPKKGGVEDLVYTGEAEVGDLENVLAKKYAKGVFRKMFPGTNPRLPDTFAEVKVKCSGVPTAAPKKA